MRKLLCLLMFMILIPAYAPAVRFLTLLRPEPVNPYETIWKAICMVESSNRPHIINHKEQAYGIIQVRKARLDDFNKETGQSYCLSDCLRPDVSKIVFMHNAVRFNPTDYRLIARDWNRSRTEKYWNRIKKHLNTN